MELSGDVDESLALSDYLWTTTEHFTITEAIFIKDVAVWGARFTAHMIHEPWVQILSG